MAWQRAEIAGAALNDTTDATSYTVPSFDPEPNRLYILVFWAIETGNNVQTPTATFNGTGLSWTLVGTAKSDNGSGMTVFRALSTGDHGAGTTTVDFGAVTHEGAHARVYEYYEDVDGVITTGTQGEDAIGSSVSANAQGASTDWALTIPAFAGSGSMTFAAFMGNQATGAPFTVDATGWTARANANYTGGSGYGGSHCIFVQDYASADTAVTATASASVAYGGVAFEIKKNAGAAGPVDRAMPRGLGRGLMRGLV